MTLWLLFLICTVLIALCYLWLGSAIAQNPDGSMTSLYALKKIEKDLPDTKPVHEYCARMYGSSAKKGGYALLVLSVVGMLCVLNQSDAAINIAGGLLFLLEVLFYFGLLFYCRKKAADRFENSPAGSVKNETDKTAKLEQTAGKVSRSAVPEKPLIVPAETSSKSLRVTPKDADHPDSLNGSIQPDFREEKQKPVDHSPASAAETEKSAPAEEMEPLQAANGESVPVASDDKPSSLSYFVVRSTPKEKEKAVSTKPEPAQAEKAAIPEESQPVPPVQNSAVSTLPEKANTAEKSETTPESFASEDTEVPTANAEEPESLTGRAPNPASQSTLSEIFENDETLVFEDEERTEHLSKGPNNAPTPRKYREKQDPAAAALKQTETILNESFESGTEKPVLSRSKKKAEQEEARPKNYRSIASTLHNKTTR